MDARRCGGTTRDGRPCDAPARPGEPWCPWHSPTLAERRREWSAKGGGNRSNKARARKALPDGALTAAEVRGLLGLVLKGVIAGEIEPGVGTAAANIARALNDLARTAEFEGRLAEVERLAGRAS